MYRWHSHVCNAVFACSIFANAQIAEEIPTPVVRASTHVVLLDVVVTDTMGNPVKGIQAAEFEIEESGKRQTLRFIDAHDEEIPQLQEAAVPLRQDVYTNRPKRSFQSGPLNVLLLDALNTSTPNQSYARQQLLGYAATQLKTGQPTAVYALTNRLIQLQDFTTDPSDILDAIRTYKPVDLAEKNATTMDTSGVARLEGGRQSPEKARMRAMLEALEAERAAVALPKRIANTLAAFRALARALGGHPGRKNLIWVSSAFPFTLMPPTGELMVTLDRSADPTAPPPLPNQGSIQKLEQLMQAQYSEEIRQTAALLADVQTAIYPVDARGLIVGGVAVVNADRGSTPSAERLGRAVTNSLTSLSSPQENMREIARLTGGRAFYNRNDINNAVALAAADGSASYTLGYYPANKKWNGNFRSVKVKVKRPNVRVRHRVGYYAYKHEGSDTGASGKRGQQLVAGPVGSDSTLVLFDAQLAAKPAQNGKSTFPVMFRVDPKSVSWGEAGKRDVDIDLYVLAIDSAGKIAANNGMTVVQSLDDDQYSQVARAGLVIPVEITLSGGDYTVKLVVRDNRTGMIGSLTVPVKVN